MRGSHISGLGKRVERLAKSHHKGEPEGAVYKTAPAKDLASPRVLES